jgi:hypothetical protein
MDSSTYAYAQGFSVKLAEYNVTPIAFIQAAAQSGDASLIKVAQTLYEGLEYEKRAFNPSPEMVGLLQASPVPFVGGVASAYSDGGDWKDGARVMGGGLVGAYTGSKALGALGTALGGAKNPYAAMGLGALGAMAGSGIGGASAEHWNRNNRGVADKVRGMFGF